MEKPLSVTVGHFDTRQSITSASDQRLPLDVGVFLELEPTNTHDYCRAIPRGRDHRLHLSTLKARASCKWVLVGF